MVSQSCLMCQLKVHSCYCQDEGSSTVSSTASSINFVLYKCSMLGPQLSVPLLTTPLAVLYNYAKNSNFTVIMQNVNCCQPDTNRS